MHSLYDSLHRLHLGEQLRNLIQPSGKFYLHFLTHQDET